jgi:hypothetical protein
VAVQQAVGVARSERVKNKCILDVFGIHLLVVRWQRRPFTKHK